MNLAGIDDGDLVVIRQQAEAKVGDIVVVLLDVVERIPAKNEIKDDFE